jgi:hypothetical protein
LPLHRDPALGPGDEPLDIGPMTYDNQHGYDAGDSDLFV